MGLEAIDLRAGFKIIWKRLFMIVSIIVVAVITSGGFSYYVLEKEYESVATLIVGSSSIPSAEYQLQYSDVILYQELVKTYQEIAKSRTVAKVVINDLKLDYNIEALQKKITVGAVGDTQVISIKVVDSNPVRVSRITNKLVEVFKKQVATIMQIDSINVIDEAAVPRSPISPRPVMNMAIAFVAALTLGVGIAFLLDYIDRTIKTPQDVEQYLALSVIGEIFEMPKPKLKEQ